MDIEERIGTLERDLRRVRSLNRWAGALLLLAVGGAVAGFTQQPGATTGPIRTTGLTIVDENGKTRAMLSVDKDGPVFSMWDENGEIRAWLSVNKDGPGFSMSDENGKLRAGLGVNNDGPGFLMSDENGEIRAMLSVSKAGPGFVMWDENRKILWRAPSP